MSFEVVQREVASWNAEEVRRLQGFLVALNHQRNGTLARFGAKLDDPDPARWVTLEQAEKTLGLTDTQDDE